MESFFSTLKIERVYRKHYATRDAAPPMILRRPRSMTTARQSESCHLQIDVL